MDRKLEMLRRVPLFAGLNERGLEDVGRLTDEIDLPAGTTLMQQGTTGHDFFLILDGTVSIERDGKVVNRLGEGEFFGEIALLDGRPRSASVKTETSSRLLVLGHREFNSLVDEFPEVRIAVLQALAQRVRRLEPDGSQ
jgi:CRP/FNR family cyclic AMP-dependent transcriptional regulator